MTDQLWQIKERGSWNRGAATSDQLAPSPEPRDTASRWRAIREVIESRPIRTQRDLRSHLLKRGFRVSQITVSRDLEDLRMVKVNESDGTLRYRSVERSPSKAGLHVFLVDRVVAVATSEPDRTADLLKQANLPGVIEVISQEKTVWIAATVEGLARLKLFLKKELPEKSL